MKHSLALMVCVSLPLAACTPEVGDDLRIWADGVRRSAPEPASDAPAGNQPSVIAYDPAARRDPFDTARIHQGLSVADAAERPDAGRQREVLEAYPLDSLQMVGSLRRAGRAVALVQAEQRLYQVKVGDHIGQDFGQVTAIREQAIDITERIQDGTGQWQRRQVQLGLRSVHKP